MMHFMHQLQSSEGIFVKTGIINMSSPKNTSSTSWLTYASVAIASALIGFSAVYLAGNLISDRANSQQTSGTSQLSTTKDQASGVDDTKLNVGDMTAFVFKKQPEALPNFTFNNAAGNPISLKSFNGKVILLNLWATWCAPCLEEMPYLDELQAKLGSDAFEVVAVSLDRKSPAKPAKFLKDIDAKSLHLYHDPSAELNFKLKVIGMPSTLLIDAQGREIGRLVGPAEWHGEDAVRLIKAYLPNSQS